MKDAKKIEELAQKMEEATEAFELLEPKAAKVARILGEIRSTIVATSKPFKSLGCEIDRFAKEWLRLTGYHYRVKGGDLTEREKMGILRMRLSQIKAISECMNEKFNRSIGLPFPEPILSAKKIKGYKARLRYTEILQSPDLLPTLPFSKAQAAKFFQALGFRTGYSGKKRVFYVIGDWYSEPSFGIKDFLKICDELRFAYGQNMGLHCEKDKRKLLKKGYALAAARKKFVGAFLSYYGYFFPAPSPFEGFSLERVLASSPLHSSKKEKGLEPSSYGLWERTLEIAPKTAHHENTN